MNIQENNTPRATDQSNESSQGSSAQHENSTTIPVENLALKEDGKNLGSGPAPHIADGGIE
ncbi:MAG: hypothetical protein JWQ96_1280, partial [Segetibacter sp.]|nr:hypothetical protein [Segetibacter sp.]